MKKIAFFIALLLTVTLSAQSRISAPPTTSTLVDSTTVLLTENGKTYATRLDSIVNYLAPSFSTVEKVDINAATYTFLEADIEAFKQHYIADTQTDVTLTIPTTTLTGVHYIFLQHKGTGTITIEGDVGVTFTTLTTDSTYGIALVSDEANVWRVLTLENEGGSVAVPSTRVPFGNAAGDGLETSQYFTYNEALNNIYLANSFFGTVLDNTYLKITESSGNFAELGHLNNKPTLKLYEGGFGALITAYDFTADRTIEFQDKDGTVALLSDVNLQSVLDGGNYAVSTDGLTNFYAMLDLNLIGWSIESTSDKSTLETGDAGASISSINKSTGYSSVLSVGTDFGGISLVEQDSLNGPFTSVNIDTPTSYNNISFPSIVGGTDINPLDLKTSIYVGEYNASTNTPALSNTYTGQKGAEYKVTVSGTVDFGAGDIELNVGDILSNDGSVYYKKVDNNQSGGTQTASDGTTFSGEIDLSNYKGVYYDEYDLDTSGQITFSIGASDGIFNFAYVPILSDGITEFATKANLDAVFDEQYGIPTDRILDEGTHYVYITKNPRAGKASISIPVNEYNPDTTAPTVLSATIEDASPDELIVVYSEDVNNTDTTALSLDTDFSALTVDSIISGSGTDTITYQLSGDALNGETGNFVYGASNTVTDLNGNNLASGSTAVTNNVAGAIPTITWTLDASFTESPTDTFTKSGSNGLTTGLAVSNETFTGAFTFQIEMIDTLSRGGLIGISTTSANNSTLNWDYSVYSVQNTLDARVITGDTLGTTYTDAITLGSGAYLQIKRDASNNIGIYIDDVLIETLGTLSGAVYLHFQQHTVGNKVYNPEFIQN